jgi:hypothetical protein
VIGKRVFLRGAMSPAIRSRPYRAGELTADRVIHLIGSILGVVGSVVLLASLRVPQTARLS